MTGKQRCDIPSDPRNVPSDHCDIPADLRDMTRPERIRLHPVFLAELDRLTRMEKDREFCGHDMQHFLDVARTAWILNLENGYGIRKDIVYAVGLLHDIGKGRQYEFGTPHHLASAELAETIMADCGYTPEEREEVAYAIRLHRKPAPDEASLVRILYQADKKTRLCFLCQAQDTCNWSDEKRNHHLEY